MSVCTICGLPGGELRTNGCTLCLPAVNGLPSVTYSYQSDSTAGIDTGAIWRASRQPEIEVLQARVKELEKKLKYAESWELCDKALGHLLEHYEEKLSQADPSNPLYNSLSDACADLKQRAKIADELQARIKQLEAELQDMHITLHRFQTGQEIESDYLCRSDLELLKCTCGRGASSVEKP